MEEKEKRFSWYPGHIKKAKDELKSKWLNLVDVVIEVVDGRVPICSKYPSVDEEGGEDELWKDKKLITIYSKRDLTDISAFREHKDLLLINIKQPQKWLHKLKQKIKQETQDAQEKLNKQGRKRKLRVGVCGLPNTGKTSLLRVLAGGQIKSKIANKPGVTRNMIWLPSKDFDLLDTPGITPFSVGISDAYKLALCNLIPQKLFEDDLLEDRLVEILTKYYPSVIKELATKNNQEEAKKQLRSKFASEKLKGICLDRFND